MRLKWFLALLVSITLFSYEDNDLDGVDDSYDECLDTPFMDIVDRSGCSVQSLVSPHHFDFIVGFTTSISEINSTEDFSTTTTSLQADYFYRNYNITFSSSYDNSQNEMGNTKVAFGYEFIPVSDITLNISAGVILPTAPSESNVTNNTDYTLSFSLAYSLWDTTFFANYAFVAVEDVSDYYQYQDSNSFLVGVGNKLTNNFYASLSYSIAQSKYSGEDDYKDITLYLKYLLDESWFINGSGFYGVGSTNESGASLKVGYYW